MCTGLISVEIPNSVTFIGTNTFFGCTNLTSVTIGSGVTDICDFAFSGCAGLTSVMFENKAGWKAGSTTITEEQLSDPANAAILLTETYMNNYSGRS